MNIKPKIKIKNIFRHFKRICVHKYWVFHYCRLMGIPWQGLVHDMSKFSPMEFWEGVRWYTDNGSPINECKAANGWSAAWMHHRGRNPHHYEYWQDDFDHGGHPLEMPMKYKKEMLCDHLGAGRAYYGKDFSYEKELEWWENKLSKPLAMHENDKLFVTAWVRLLAEEGDNAFRMVGK